MQCPKCRGAMRTYERNGVHIDQCESCRGIFLDYGELESLTRMESQWSQQAHAAPPPPPPPPAHGAPAYGAPGYGAPAWGAPHHGGHYGHHRQRSWVGMLFST
ncbi:zf-TFIIB domain-containing protein [Streptosporangium sp. NPDC023615]|uniref:TFIIB-type zinc ribbon-containing protein n=1 Tax=Streptosporangium sp. NPDC023615 TaxID=3154794 RepID=UPI00341D1B70